MKTPTIGDKTWNPLMGEGGVPIIQAPALLELRSALHWLQDCASLVRQTLVEIGFLVIRGLPVESAAEVALVRDALMLPRALNPERTAQRTHLGDEVYSANDLPPSHHIGLHNENSYALEFPGVLLFACLEAPTAGGCTIVADGRRVLARLPSSIASKYRNHGWLLTRHFHPQVGQSIESAFGSTSSDDIRAYCEKNAISPLWLSDGVLRTTQLRTATVRHPVTHEEALFGHMSFWSRWSLDATVLDILTTAYGNRLPFDSSYGDGQPIPQSEMLALRKAYSESTCREPWRRGDIMLVDNLLASHGRDAFQGNRRVVVTMGESLRVDACSPSVVAAPGPC